MSEKEGIPSCSIVTFEQSSLFALINNTNDLMWSVDRNFNLITFNKAFDALINHITGKHISPGNSAFVDGFPEETLFRYRQYYDRAFKGEAFKVIDHVTIPLELWSELSFYPIFNGAEIIGTACYSHDITESKRAKDELTNVHKRLTFHIENTPMGYIEWDKNYSIRTWSKRTEEIFGWTEEEYKARQKEGLGMIYEEDNLWVSLIDYELATGNIESNTVINRNYTKDGRVIWCEWFNSVMKDDDGTVLSIMSQVMDITEKKNAEKKILHANKLYSFLSQVNQVLIDVKDEARLFAEVCRIAVDYGSFKVAWIGKIDPSAMKINLTNQKGMEPEEIVRCTDYTYFENGAIDMVVTTGKNYISSGIENDPILKRWKSLFTTRKWLSFMILPIMRAGKVYATLNIFSDENDFFNPEEIALLEKATEDISFALRILEKDEERKAMEERLIHSESRLNQAQAVAHLGSWELDLITGQGIWSDEACTIFGLDAGCQNQTYDSWLSFIHPDDLDYVVKASGEGIKNNTGISLKHRIIRTDGTVRFLFIRSEIEYDKDGNKVGLYGIVHDITEIREAQLAQEQSEANLRLIMDLIPQSINAKDINGKILYANKSFAALYGLEPDQLINQTIEEALPSRIESELDKKQHQQVISSGFTKVIREQPFTDSEGNKRFFYTIKVPYATAYTNQKTVLDICMDITGDKAAAAHDKRMTEDLVQRNKDLEQFSYIVSHNLRAPVANITGLNEILQFPDLTAEEQRSIVRDLDVSVRSLDDVIIDLNHILQVKNKVSKRREEISLTQLMETIIAGTGTQLKSDKVEIITDFSAVNKIQAVKSYMHSILQNLITNSINYKHPDRNPVIEIKSTLSADKIIITIKDNGLGIDLDKHSKLVFGLYKRFHRQVEGKGMGLFMVKTQVESMGGRITLKSQVNIGSEFRIELDNHFITEVNN